MCLIEIWENSKKFKTTAFIEKRLLKKNKEGGGTMCPGAGRVNRKKSIDTVTSFSCQR